MSNRCSEFPCTTINCEGCKDGELWCEDPQCVPYCRGCELPAGHDKMANFVFLILIILITCIVIALMVFYGPRYVQFKQKCSNKVFVLESTNGFDRSIE